MNHDGAVEPTEFLLRRIPKNVEYCNSKLNPAITPLAFRPNNNDTDGISLFREREVSRADLSKSGRKPPYIVAGLKARDIFDLGLNIVPTDDVEGVPGHVVVPELSIEAYRNNKTRVVEINFKLAMLASADIFGI
jgi:hypothetical protein